MSSGVDIIGDVHGEFEKLEQILELLEYTKDASGTWVPTRKGRTVLFLGDLIDRGPNQRAVLTTVRAMEQVGSARALMGNHELNALLVAQEHPAHLGHTLRSLGESDQPRFQDVFDGDERAEWLEWMLTLPLWLREEGFRAVHACWHKPSIRAIRRALGGNRLRSPNDLAVFAGSLWTTSAEDEQIELAAKGRLFDPIEVILKGPEVCLRDYGLPMFDGTDKPREMARIAWWREGEHRLRHVVELPKGANVAGTDDPYPKIPKDYRLKGKARSYVMGSRRRPIFFGHYWREWPPEVRKDFTKMACCVDFSNKMGKGPLVAYRWNDGDATIKAKRFVATAVPTGV